MNFDSITNNNLSEAEINQFNGKFTVYEGEGVSPAEVNSLLNVIFSHNDTEKLRPNIQYYVRISGKISMDENTTSLPTIEGTNNYNIECKFDENGLVNEIVITEGEIDLEDVGTNDVEATDNISDTAGNIIGMLETLN